MGRFKKTSSSMDVANEESSIVNEDTFVDVDGYSSSDSSDDDESEDIDVEDLESDDYDTDSGSKPRIVKKGHHNELERRRRMELSSNHGDLKSLVKKLFPRAKVSGRDRTLSLASLALQKVSDRSRAIKKSGKALIYAYKCIRATRVPPEKLAELNADIKELEELFGRDGTSPDKEYLEEIKVKDAQRKKSKRRQ